MEIPVLSWTPPCSNLNVGRNFKMDSARCFLLSVAVTRSTFRVCVFVCAGVRELVRRCEMCDKKGTPSTYRCLRNKSLLYFFEIMLHLSPTPRISMLRRMWKHRDNRNKLLFRWARCTHWKNFFPTLKFGERGYWKHGNSQEAFISQTPVSYKSRWFLAEIFYMQRKSWISDTVVGV